MSLILDGTSGLSDVDGTAAAPAIRGTDTNTGIFFPAADTIAFSEGGVEVARIDSSGNLLVGIVNTDPVLNRTNGLALFADGSIRSRTNNIWSVGIASTSGDNIQFWTDNGSARVAAGKISSNGSTTAYNTSSDYRLKEAIAPMTDALAKVALLKPCTYKWKVDGSDGQGFIAHELAEVEAGCVTGEKDAVDADGNPQYQGIDTSFLVATLTAAIQEQQTLITALTARITALEAPIV